MSTGVSVTPIRNQSLIAFFYKFNTTSSILQEFFQKKRLLSNIGAALAGEVGELGEGAGGAAVVGQVDAILGAGFDMVAV